jgi:hypothetical protein
MTRHVHGGIFFAMAVIAVVVIFNFTARTLAAHYPESPAAQGLAYVA